MPEIKKIIRRCSWCGKIMGSKPGKDFSLKGVYIKDQLYTDGTCEKCLVKNGSKNVHKVAYEKLKQKRR